MSRVLTPEELQALRNGEPYIPAPRERYHVVVEAGHTDLTTDEIAALQPGDVIALDRMTSQPLEVIVNAVTVARAFLTERHGRVAVRIVTLERPASPTRSSDPDNRPAPIRRTIP